MIFTKQRKRHYLQNKDREKIRKAAVTLLSLGNENAARVLAHLQPEEAEKLIKAILEIKELTEVEKKEALKNLQKELKRRQEEIVGGRQKAQEWLTKAFGEERAKKFLEKLEQRDLQSKFRELEEYPAEHLAKILEKESDTIAATVLAHLNPQVAAKVLALFHDERKVQIARRIAKTQKIAPEALLALVKKLQEKLTAQVEKEELDNKIDGEEILSQILRYMPVEKEEELLENLEKQAPELTERLKEKLFTFRDLLAIDRQGIGLLLEMIPDLGVWARALKGAGRELRQHIFNSMSINRAKDLADEMERLGAIPLREVEYNRRQILRMAEKLREEGKLFFGRDRDQYIF